MVQKFVTPVEHRCVAFRSSAVLACGFSYLIKRKRLRNLFVSYRNESAE